MHHGSITQPTKAGWRQPVLQVMIFLCVQLFAYTALSKLIAPGKFHAQIQHAPLIEPFADTIIWAVPALELTVALLIILPPLRRLGLRMFTGIMILFTFYVFFIIWFAPHIPCSCGGVLELMGWGDHLIFNILFVLIGLGALRLTNRLIDMGKHPNHWKPTRSTIFFRKKQGEAENL